MLDTMRGMQASAVDGANAVLQAQNRREMAAQQAKASAGASKMGAIGAGLGLVLAPFTGGASLALTAAAAGSMAGQ
jgi:hypothetical protein